MTIDDFDDGFDSMVERIDAGEECPHCHARAYDGAILQTLDLSRKPLHVCGCGAQWRSYTEVSRPREAA